MKIPLEEYIPYRILALLVLAVFYGIYLIKQWGGEVPGYPGHANRAKKRSTDPHGRNPDGHRHRGNDPRTTAVHHIWLESSACKRPLYRVLRRSAGRLTLFAFCYLHEG